MAASPGERPATRREVYSAVAPVWIFLMIVIANSMRSGVHWPDLILFAGAAIATAMYLRAAYRSAA